MRVIAAPGLQVPREEDMHEYIEAESTDPVEVPDTSYYRRRIATGELLLIDDESLTKNKRGSANQPAQEPVE